MPSGATTAAAPRAQRPREQGPRAGRSACATGTMTVGEGLAIAAAGAGAGTINAVVGSGTLLTFPTLLAFGYTPLVANVSNTIGLVPGSLSGALGYRAELAGQRRRLLVLGGASALGGLAGAAILLALPASSFRAVLPVLIALALVLVVAQPRIAAAIEARRRRPRPEHGGRAAAAAVFAAGVYGGYFGVVQGILVLATLGLSLPEGEPRINGPKNLLVGLANLAAGIVFIAVAHIAWLVAALLAVGAVLGGQLGARVGRRLPPPALQALIVAVGLAALVDLIVS
jgi:uncharacterized membrane protein YfcA